MRGSGKRHCLPVHDLCILAAEERPGAAVAGVGAAPRLPAASATPFTLCRLLPLFLSHLAFPLNWRGVEPQQAGREGKEHTVFRWKGAGDARARAYLGGTSQGCQDACAQSQPQAGADVQHAAVACCTSLAHRSPPSQRWSPHGAAPPFVPTPRLHSPLYRHHVMYTSLVRSLQKRPMVLAGTALCPP